MALITSGFVSFRIQAQEADAAILVAKWKEQMAARQAGKVPHSMD